MLTFVSIPDVLRNPQARIQNIFPGGSKRWNPRPNNSISKKKGGKGGGGVYGKISHYFYFKIALYFFDYNIVSEYLGRFEGRGSGGPPREKFE